MATQDQFAPNKRLLSAGVIALMNKSSAFVGDRILAGRQAPTGNGPDAPEIGVSGSIRRVDLTMGFGEDGVEYRRNPGGDIQMVPAPTSDLIDYSCELYTAGYKVPRKNEQTAIGYKVRESHQAKAMTNLRIVREKLTASLFTTPGNWTNSLQLTGGDRFSESGSDVVEIISDAISAMEGYGYTANQVLATRGAHNDLMRNKAFNQFGPMANDRRIQTANSFGAWLNQSFVEGDDSDTDREPISYMVGRARYNSARRGQTPVLADIWTGKAVWVGFINRNNAPYPVETEEGIQVMVEATAAMRLQAGQGWDVEENYDFKTKSQFGTIEIQETQKVICPELGYLIYYT